ncbi:hypothetical protein F2Q69_00021120 [Brassica cretica]|uniref:Uncharacterized protein n=1 Tax=Brassica cretica TaxID=69181 RepID=A0A8S9QB03_BRACR|nr:hypothetical protein F2Q69_00021120 [Brassica cretica]
MLHFSRTGSCASGTLSGFTDAAVEAVNALTSKGTCDTDLGDDLVRVLTTEFQSMGRHDSSSEEEERVRRDRSPDERRRVRVSDDDDRKSSRRDLCS